MPRMRNFIEESIAVISTLATNVRKKVNVKKAIQSSIEDFRTLFPEDKLTSSRIMDWCGCGNQKRIYRILRNDYQMIGKNRGSYYG